MSKSIKPVHISEDIWFYPTPKGFEFVVWSTHNKIGNRQATQFRISKKKLAKYFQPSLPTEGKYKCPNCERSFQDCKCFLAK